MNIYDNYICFDMPACFVMSKHFVSFSEILIKIFYFNYKVIKD